MKSADISMLIIMIIIHTLSTRKSTMTKYGKSGIKAVYNFKNEDSIITRGR